VVKTVVANWRPWFFRAVAVSAIIFAAGHSGGFLNRQEGSLAVFQWGMFGALVAGMALWGGMYIFSAHGDRWGLVIALVAALADCFMAYGWFVSTNASVSPLLLATWPPLLAVLAGVIEGRMARHTEAMRVSEAVKDAEAERKLKAKLATMEMKAKLGTSTPAPPTVVQYVERPTQVTREAPRDRPRGWELEWLANWDGRGSVKDVAIGMGVSVGKAHGILTEQHWHPAGKGVWSHNGDGPRE
jgi:hypothetical protein